MKKGDNEMSEKKTGYKGFDNNLKCRDFQFEIGKEYNHTGPVSLCNSGFHYCENPLDILHYYPLGNSRFAQVEAEGVSNENAEDSKKVSKSLKVVAEISLEAMIKGAVKFVFEKIEWGKAENKTTATTGEGANSATTGNYANSATTGYRANSATTGEGANSATTGNYANSATTGEGANSATTGEGANSEAMGKESIAAGLGIKNKAKAALGCWIVLSEWKQNEDYSWHIVGVKTAKVDGKKIKADTFYKLVGGKFTEAA